MKVQGLTRLVAPAALALAFVSGCSAGGTSIEDSSDTAQAASPDTKVAPKPGKGERFGGPEKMFREAIGNLDLNATQKATIDKALADAFPEKARKEKGEAMKPVFGLVASQIRAGSIDEKAINAKIAEVAPGKEDDHRAKMAAAIQTVHDTLTSEQRAQLVDELESKVSEHQGKERDHERAGKKEHAHHGGGELGFLLHGVDVDDAQREKIKSALDAAGIAPPEKGEMKSMRGEMKAKMAAMLEAFKGDKFDAASALPEKEEHGHAEHLARMVKALSVVVPLLDQDQREALAKNIENGPQPGAFGQHGFHGPAEGDAEE